MRVTYAGSVSIAVGGRDDRHAVRIGHANRDRRPSRGELSEPVVSEERQMRLAGIVVNHAEGAGRGVDIRWRAARRDGCRDRTVYEDIVSGANQAAEGLAAGVGGKDVLTDSRHPAVSRLASVYHRRECAVAEQPVLAGVGERDDG